jgi:hypothetical protein
VEINVSYFDAAIATDRGVFVSQCVKMLSENRIWSTEKEWAAMIYDDFDKGKATERQQ